LILFVYFVQVELGFETALEQAVFLEAQSELLATLADADDVSDSGGVLV